jgi:diaminopimelate epimerase
MIALFLRPCQKPGSEVGNRYAGSPGTDVWQPDRDPQTATVHGIKGRITIYKSDSYNYMRFYKYHGTGNDFILIDDRAELFPDLDQPLIERLCHRRFGIGADGLILLRPAPNANADADFRMVYFNADGHQSTMCGNGGRCLVRFAHDLGLIGDETRFLAIDGPHTASVQPEQIALGLSGVAPVRPVDDVFFLDTGSPHVVRFVADVQATDVVGEGRVLRHDPRFGPGGSNVNFVQQLDSKTLSVRTYERGVEDETYSCGTGVTAAVLAAHRVLGVAGPVTANTPGGTLSVDFAARPDGSFGSIRLIGPAVRVFEGKLTV